MALLDKQKTIFISFNSQCKPFEPAQNRFCESSNSKMTTFDTPYDEWVSSKQEMADLYIGLAFMRVKENLNTPGRIIKPGQIPALKQIKSE